MRKIIVKYLDMLLKVRIFLFFNALILVSKIGYSFYQSFPGLYFEDWHIAENIAKYGVYAEFMNIGPTAYKLPIYPFFLSFFMWLSPAYPKEFTVIAQHFLFFLVPLLIIEILRLLNCEKSGIIAAYFFIFSPAYFFYSNVLEVTNIFIPIFLVWIYFYLKLYRQEYSLQNLTFLGISTGVLFLTQVVVVPFAIIMLFGLLFFQKISWRRFLIVGAVASLCYSPWIIRNYVVFDKVIVTKTPVWQNIYLSFTPLNIWKELNLISAENEQTVFKMRTYVDEFQMEKIYKDETLKALDGNEDLYVKKAVQNALILWFVPARYMDDNSLIILLGRKIFVIITNLLSLIAMLYVYRINRRLFWAFLLLFCGFTVPYMIGHAANMRFKLDFEWVQYVLVSLLFCKRCVHPKPKKIPTLKPAE